MEITPIRAARLRQPLKELQRKALKSRNRANLWTQEQLDYADAVALKLHRRLSRRRPPIF